MGGSGARGRVRAVLTQINKSSMSIIGRAAWPQTISYRISPRANWSLSGPMTSVSPSPCSGDM